MMMPSFRCQHHAEFSAKWKQIDQLFDCRFYYVGRDDNKRVKKLVVTK
jgi:hypothetical protein